MSNIQLVSFKHYFDTFNAQIHLFVYLFIYLSIYLFIYLFIYFDKWTLFENNIDVTFKMHNRIYTSCLLSSFVLL